MGGEEWGDTGRGRRRDEWVGEGGVERGRRTRRRAERSRGRGRRAQPHRGGGQRRQQPPLTGSVG